MNNTKQLGQYFTPEFVADFMVNMVTKPKDSYVLEPSSGNGVFIKALKKAGFDNCIGYEIDSELVDNQETKVINESFISAKFDKKFELVIGNPPYVRWKNLAKTQKDELSTDQLWNRYFNSLSDYLYIFILKSIELLEDQGELIFITPEYWLNTMHSQSLRNYLLNKGFISDIYHFSETPIFDKVASSIIIFKYIKCSVTHADQTINIYRYSSKKKLVKADLSNIHDNKLWDTFEIKQFTKNENWILAPEKIKNELVAYENKCKVKYDHPDKLKLFLDEDTSYARLGNISKIANGLVSGLDKAFQLPEDIKLTSLESNATLNVVKAKDIKSYIKIKTTKYIYLNENIIDEAKLRSSYPNFYEQFSNFKNDLLKRYSYNKNINYWDWVFLRSMGLFKQKRYKIFVPCKERITNKTRLRFYAADHNEFPTQDMTAIYLNDYVKESIHYITALLNHKVTYDWVLYKGLLKGGIAEFSERPLSSIPIRLIDWSNKNDVRLHDEITKATINYISNNGTIVEIDKLVTELLN